MTLKKTPVLLTLLFFSAFLNADNYFKINFIDNNLEIAKQQAQREGKLIMVDFWASWCSPCKWMDEQTFSKPEVANYLNSKYVSVRVDIDNFDGMSYKDKYNVRFLPTILVLDANGRIVKKYEESMAPSKLLKVLKDHEENKVIPSNIRRNMIQGISNPVSRPNKEIKDAPRPKFNPATTGTSRNYLANNAVNNNNDIANSNNINYTPKPDNTYDDRRITSANTSITGYNDKPAYSESKKDIYKASAPGKIADIPNRTYSVPAKDAVSEVGLYQLNVKKAPRNGFSVQVGAYYDYKNVLIEVAKFQKSFAEEVLVHISEFNGSTCYKVMLGHYYNRESAANDKKLLVEAGVKDAFIKDLTTL